MLAGRLVISCLSLLLVQGIENKDKGIENKDFARDFKCDFSEQDFSTLENSYAQWVPDTASWDRFQGQNLHTKPHPELIASADGHLKVGSCQVPTEKGVWRVQRIGPFRSRGSYDWWRLAWSDVAGLAQLLQDGQPVGVRAHWMGPVDTNGHVLGLPPIHVHHVHVTPGAGGTPTCDAVTCTTSGRNCCDYAMGIEHHGDFELPAGEGGNISFGTDYGKYTKQFHEKLFITCELNDVRPRGADPIEWWYQVAFLIDWKPQGASSHVLSQHTFYSPGPLSITSRIGLTALLRNPANEDSFHWHTQRWPFSGTLVQAKPHTHMGNSQQMLIFRGSPEQLGLGEEMRRLWNPNTPILTKGKVAGAHFEEPAWGANNKAMLEHVFRSMAHSQRALNHNSAAPLLVCWATARSQTYANGVSYDRASRVENCTEQVRFSEGEQWTVIGFDGNASLDASKFGPETWYRFPQHHSWLLFFVSDDGKSHFTWGLGSVNADSTGPMTTWTDMVRSLVFGIPTSPPTFFDRYILVPVSILGMYFLRLYGIQWSILEGPPFASIALAVAVTSAFIGATYVMFLCVWRRRRQNASVNLSGSKATLCATLAFTMVLFSTTCALTFVLNIWVVPRNLVITNRFDFLAHQPPPSTTYQIFVSVLFIAAFTLALGLAAKLFRRYLEGTKYIKVEKSTNEQDVTPYDHDIEDESLEMLEKRPGDITIGRSLTWHMGVGA